jgi:cytochrome c biogenesis protein ResB
LIDVRPLDGGAAFQVVAFPSASPHDEVRSPYALLLSSYEVPKAVGIRYARNPGYPVVWAGLVLMMAGLTVAFYLPARRLWILVEPRDGRITLRVESSRGAEHGTAWAESIRRAIEEELKGGR